MKEICKEDLVTTGSELFGSEVRKKITERANTIEAFNKAIALVEGTSSQKTNTSSHFFFIQVSDWEVWGQTGQELLHPIQQVQTTKKVRESNKGQPTKPVPEETVRPEVVNMESMTVGGNLRHHIQAWQSNTDNPWVLRCVQGYALEFSETPSWDNWPPRSPNLSKEQEEVLDREIPIPALMDKGAIEPAQDRRLLQPNVCFPKERQRLEANNQPQAAERLPPCIALQDGGDTQFKGYSPAKQLHGEDRSSRCLSHSTCGQEAPQLSQVPLEREKLPFSEPTVRASNGTKSLHKDFAPLGSKDEEIGYLLSRRYTRPGPKQRVVEVPHGDLSSGAGEFGLQVKSQEVHVDAFSSDRLSGLPDRLDNHEALSPRGESRQDSQGVSASSQQDCGVGTKPCPFDWAVVVNTPCCQDSTASLLGSAEVATSDTSELTGRVRSNCSTEQRVPRRSALVASPLERCKWALSCPAICGSDHSHRCIKDRLGCNQQEVEHSRSMDERRKIQAHINQLEMKAVLLALKSLVSSRRNIHIQLFIDNSTTITYLNHRGGTH